MPSLCPSKLRATRWRRAGSRTLSTSAIAALIGRPRRARALAARTGPGRRGVRRRTSEAPDSLGSTRRAPARLPSTIRAAVSRRAGEATTSLVGPLERQDVRFAHHAAGPLPAGPEVRSSIRHSSAWSGWPTMILNRNLSTWASGRGRFPPSRGDSGSRGPGRGGQGIGPAPHRHGPLPQSPAAGRTASSGTRG